MTTATPRPHYPVLLDEILNFVRAQNEMQFFVDGTFGRGGHSTALLESCPGLHVLGLDQDEDAIQYGEKEYASLVQNQRLILWHANFHHWTDIQAKIKSVLKRDTVDGLLLDLGVSSPQLDESERGFSFLRSGPLDMRMNRQQKFSAAEIVNTYTDKQLVQLFRDLGEIRNPHRVVNAIVLDRKKKAFETTGDLAGLIERVDGWKHKGYHPATQYFLALRMEVNRELDGLTDCLPEMLKSLSPNGLLIVITFHSLEDRIVKNIFKTHEDLGIQVNKKVIQATEDEVKKNPRSRSAKLRVFQRGLTAEAMRAERKEARKAAKREQKYV